MYGNIIDWGNVPTWVSAIITSSSFAVAARVYWENRQDKIRGQAAKITVELPKRDESDVLNIRSDRLYVRNHSDMPVFDLHLVVHTYRYPGGAQVEYWTDLESSTDRVDPGEIVTLVRPMVRRNALSLPKVMGITFVDANGRRWTRMVDGFLMDRAGHQPSKYNALATAWNDPALQDLKVLSAPGMDSGEPDKPVPDPRNDGTA
ncbi:hypothetical protein [Streptomyces sp. XY332]|uniref:hypothetical protein n=1 Tax=Streptomyces sp. XY332 TaxID=1415561 RepID=UPI0006B1AF35|nr:hypothetical protein [Streptomyces sp. XY332]KOY53595.1 hypothetical protein ADK59_34765 [Streptomyces sp. XY332]